MKIIQLKWSDETEWKNIDLSEIMIGHSEQQKQEWAKCSTPEDQVAFLKQSWAEAKAKYKHKQDAEFRIVEKT